MNTQIDQILSEASQKFGWPRAVILGNSRTKSVVAARHWAICEARLRLGLSYPELGKQFGRHQSSMRAAVERELERRRPANGAAA